MAMDVRHFKRSGGVTLTAYATIAAAFTAVVDNATSASGSHVNMFPDGSGFVYTELGIISAAGRVRLFLAGTEGTSVAPIYEVILLPDIP